MKTKKMTTAALVLAMLFSHAMVASASPSKAEQPTSSGLPPPPPVIDTQFKGQLKKPLSASEKKSRADAQEQVDNQLVPLTPEQIKHIQERAVETEKIINYRGEPRNPRDRDIVWTMGGGSHTLRMAPGYVTTLIFFDAAGQPLEVAEPGAIVGDDTAIEPAVSSNAIVLVVKKPWRTTNLTVFLRGVAVPVQFTLTSERDASSADVDYQVRARVVDGAAVSLEQKDKHNMDALLKLTNGMPQQNLLTLPVLSIEKGDPGQHLNWAPIAGSIAQFKVGPEGYTYVLLKPNFRLVYPSVPNVLAALTGADGTQGYIIGGNNPRVFTAQDKNGAMYRITVQR